MKNTFFILLTFIFNAGIAQNNANVIDSIINDIENNFMVQSQNGGKSVSTLADRMKLYNIPGLSIALINDYKIEWSKAYGTINNKTKVPVASDILFEAASVTKVLVSALALHYVDHGLIDLDMDVNDYLKSWKVPENEFTKEQKVTVRLLLSHQSGLPTTNLPYKEGSTPTLVQVLNGELPALNKAAIVKHVPGSDWEYSNLGFLVIQMILEDISGNSLGQMMEEVIFEPLGMNSSTLNYPMNKKLDYKIALPHDATANVKELIMHPTALAQGALMTTASDLAKLSIELMKAYQGNSDIIISQKMVQEMLSPERELNPAIFGGIPFQQGLGVFLRDKEKNLFFGHNGDSYPGATCLLGAYPESGGGLVIMTNSANGFPFMMEILAKIESTYHWSKY